MMDSLIIKIMRQQFIFNITISSNNWPPQIRLGSITSHDQTNNGSLSTYCHEKKSTETANLIKQVRSELCLRYVIYCLQIWWQKMPVYALTTLVYFPFFGLANSDEPLPALQCSHLCNSRAVLQMVCHATNGYVFSAGPFFFFWWSWEYVQLILLSASNSK